MNKKITGNLGETLACNFLLKQNYLIIQRNFYIRGGEIDIIAQERDVLVFVEVKTRNFYSYGLPIESITPLKIKHLLKSAQFFLQKYKWGNRPYRIDVVTVDFSQGGSFPKIEHWKNITQ